MSVAFCLYHRVTDNSVLDSFDIDNLLDYEIFNFLL